MNVPVLLIAFNRPDLFSSLLSKIVVKNPSKVYISIDGPRENRPGEKERVEEVISIAKNHHLSKNFIFKINEKNLGCGKGVSSAITWFFDHEEKGIILEDDCEPNDSFFSFCDELLTKYEKDDRIGMISGDNFFFSQYSISQSYFFSSYFHIWGWASWRRAWDGYQLRTFDANEVKEVLKYKFKNRRERDFWFSQITKSFSGLFDTWDYQWVYLNFKKGRLSIMPKVNLIANTGFGDFATHTIDVTSVLNNMQTSELEFPLIHPVKIEPGYMTDNFSRKLIFRLSFLERLIFYLLSKVKNSLSRV